VNQPHINPVRQNGSTPALPCQALAAGCHVFVEKPLAMEPCAAVRARSIAQRHGLELFVGYVHLFHHGYRCLRPLAAPEQIRSLRFDWVRPAVSGYLHGGLLCHDRAITIALNGELPDRAVVLESSSGFLRCGIELSRGRSFESTMLLRHDVPRRSDVRMTCADGTIYTWYDDCVHSVEAPDENLLAPEAEYALSGELMVFRSAIAGEGQRIVDGERHLVGICSLPHEVHQGVTA
jgi:predicted dehydrogenase